jgi:hypothetical protein
VLKGNGVVPTLSIFLSTLKGHGNEADFLGFLQKWVLLLLSPLYYLSSRSDFGFEFAEIFVIEKQLPEVKALRFITPVPLGSGFTVLLIWDSMKV